MATTSRSPDSRVKTRSSTGIKIRRAAVRDVDALVELRRAQQTEFGLKDMAILDKADRVFGRWTRTRMRNKRLVAWVAERRNGGITGCGCVWLQPVHPNPHRKRTHRPYLLSMYTEPGSRGHGVASRIVEASINWCKKQGYNSLTLHASNMGRPVYKRFGFKPTSEMRLDFNRPSTRKLLQRIPKKKSA